MDMKLRLNKSSHLLVKRDISIDFFVQRFIAEMIAVLKPFSSNVATASIVVPLENKPYPSIHLDVFPFPIPFLQNLIQPEPQIYKPVF